MFISVNFSVYFARVCIFDRVVLLYRTTNRTNNGVRVFYLSSKQFHSERYNNNCVADQPHIVRTSAEFRRSLRYKCKFIHRTLLRNVCLGSSIRRPGHGVGDVDSGGYYAI